jgi:hypothetical protein
MSRILVFTSLTILTIAATAAANRIGTPSDPVPADRLLEEPPTADPKPAAPNLSLPPGETPFALIEREMRAAEQGLATGDSGERTQAAQRRAIEHLDKLIRQAQAVPRTAPTKDTGSKPEKNGATSASDKPTDNPAPAPNATPVGPPEPGVPSQLTPQDLYRRVWGHLPEKEQDRLLKNLRENDRFLPKYELEIEQYFRRLLEEPRE